MMIDLGRWQGYSGKTIRPCHTRLNHVVAKSQANELAAQLSMVGSLVQSRSRTLTPTSSLVRHHGLMYVSVATSMKKIWIGHDHQAFRPGENDSPGWYQWRSCHQVFA